MNPDFWNQRYNDAEHLYSEHPNTFLKETIGKLNFAGKNLKALVPADGDGRNGLWLASQGFQVDAFDYSSVAVAKANQRAQKAGLNYKSLVQDLNHFVCQQDSYDLIAVVYFHAPPALKQKLIELCHSCLKPGGALVVEVFSKQQLPKSSGGPKDPELLYSAEDFEKLQSHFTNLTISETETVLSEGPLHTGAASVLRVVGTRS